MSHLQEKEEIFDKAYIHWTKYFRYLLSIILRKSELHNIIGVILLTTHSQYTCAKKAVRSCRWASIYEDFGPAIAVAVAIAIEEENIFKKLRNAGYGRKTAWYFKREDFDHAKLLRELKENEPLDFQNFLGMDSETYDCLLEMIETLIKKTLNENLVKKTFISYFRFCLSSCYFSFWILNKFWRKSFPLTA